MNTWNNSINFSGHSDHNASRAVRVVNQNFMVRSHLKYKTKWWFLNFFFYRTCYLSIRRDTTARFRQKGEYTRNKETMLASTSGRVYPHASCLPQDSSFPEGRKFASSSVIHYGWAANISPLPKDIEVCILHNPLETEYQSHRNLQKVHHWHCWQDFTRIFPYFFQHCLQSYLSIPNGQYLKREIYRLKWKKKKKRIYSVFPFISICHKNRDFF